MTANFPGSGSSAGVSSADNVTLDNTSLVVSPVTNLQDFAIGIDQAILKNRGTGVSTNYVCSVVAGGTTFSQPSVVGEVHSDLGYFPINYAGAAGITVQDLNSQSTYVYIDTSNALQQQTTIPTRQDWSRKMFTMRIAVNTVSQQIIGFEYLNNPNGHYTNTIRDLYTYLLAQGVPFKTDQVVTGRADNLGFNMSSGTLMELGGTGDINNPNIRDFAEVLNPTYLLMSQTAVVSSETDLVKSWDNATTIIPLGSTTWVAHRLYRFSNGGLAMQYGQGNYANLDLAKSGALTENYVLNESLKNATFCGWWFIESTATFTSDPAKAEFVEYTIGIQGGSSSSLSGALLKGNHLSDLLDVPQALISLGLGNVTNLSDANQVEIGALDSGSITSGFGDIDVGSSTVSGGDGDFSGNVGVGVNTPGSFTNWSVGKFLDIGSSTTTHNAMALGASQTANGQLLGSVMFYNQANSSTAYNATTSKNAAYVTAWTRTTDSNAGGDSGADLAFYTKPEAGLSGEVLRIDSIGNVGIGTSSPSTKLDVSGPIKSGVYTVATVPSAAANTNAQITVTNDVIGQSVISVSNGTTWRRSYDGAAISTT
ncbi:MAG: hypothetical protein ACJAYB_000112 [Psychromonas sp.]|jgi:hypothetical protein